MQEPGRLTCELAGRPGRPGFPVTALTWGPTDGPLALLVHGFPDTAWSWRHVGPLLAAEGWRVVAPFSRGYAPTGLAPDANYQVGALVRDVLDLHTTLDGDDRALLVGHDWGALTAYGAAVSEPGIFARVVTMSVPPVATLRRVLRGRRRVSLGLRQARCSWYVAANQLPGLSERVFARLTTRLWADWSPGYDATQDLGHLNDATPTLAHRRAAIAYYRATLQPWRQVRGYRDEQRAVFRTPAQPVLYLHGRQDGCVLPEIGTLALPDLAAGSRVELVSGAGHFLQVERPDAVAAAILQFAGSPAGT